MPRLKRNYKAERASAKRRKETGVGSKSVDAKRHRARRIVKKSRSVSSNKDVGHKKPVKSGGSNKRSNLKVQSRRSNRSHGGKIGNRAGKSRGGKLGARRRWGR